MPIRPFLAGQAFDPETIRLQSNDAAYASHNLTGMPGIYVLYCQRCQHVETVKEGKAIA